MDYQDINAKTIDSWVREGWIWGQPISHEEYLEAKKGNIRLFLTPNKTVPLSWFPEKRKGLKILGLASGGAQQMPVFSAMGFDCTVLDYSELQIRSEIEFAHKEGYEINAIRADMTKPLPFADESFDIVFHPVSNCYIEHVEPVFREVYRILKKGGRFIGGYDIGTNFIVAENDETRIATKLPYNPLKNQEQMNAAISNNDGIQFSHTVEEQIGGQLKAGFILKEIYEDTNESGHLHDLNIPCFIATYCIK